MSELEQYRPMVDVDTLRYLGLDPSDVAARALVAVADRYQLDPLLGEIRLIPGRGGAPASVYVTRDGMIAIAHRSGQLDGIVVDEMRRNTTDNGWTAYVSVWRKDCSHPFRYGAQCKDTETQAKAGFGLEQALARAERRALKRAFAISSPDDDDAHDLPAGGPHPTLSPAVEGSGPVPAGPDPDPDPRPPSEPRDRSSRDRGSLPTAELDG